MPVDEVTNEVPNPAEELGSWLVVAVKQLLQRVPAIDGLKVWESKLVAVLGNVHASKQVLGHIKLFPGPLECLLVD